MVCEHDARGFAPEWLSETFSTAAFGNSVVAITAGMVAQSAADSVKLAPTSEGSSIMYGGFCMPFDLAIIVLIIASCSIWYRCFAWWEAAFDAPVAMVLESAFADVPVAIIAFVCAIASVAIVADAAIVRVTIIVFVIVSCSI